MHVVPPVHAGPVPHAHPPVAEQESAVDALHATQAAPPTPQSAAVGGVTHVGPVQQPIGQLVAVQLLQTPPEQVAPPVHRLHIAPAVPHSVSVVIVTQAPAP